MKARSPAGVRHKHCGSAVKYAEVLLQCPSRNKGLSETQPAPDCVLELQSAVKKSRGICISSAPKKHLVEETLIFPLLMLFSPWKSQDQFQSLEAIPIAVYKTLQKWIHPSWWQTELTLPNTASLERTAGHHMLFCTTAYGDQEFAGGFPRLQLGGQNLLSA